MKTTGIRVELMVDGAWVDSGQEFRTHHDACEWGYDHGSDVPGQRMHTQHGYATQDRTWRVVGVSQ